MLAPLLLAAALAMSSQTGAASADIPSPPPGERARERGLSLALRDRSSDDEDSDERGWRDDERTPHLFISAWAGEGLLAGGSGAGVGLLSGEVAWAFRSVDVGISATAYRNVPADDVVHPVTPVVLLRLTQRFQTRRGFEAAFSLGFGAGRLAAWHPWYQVALGLRVPFGPMFLGGELAFEQLDILRLAAGLGVAF